MTKGLSARQAEALAKRDAISKQKMAKKPAKSSDIKALEQQAAHKLGLALNIDWDEAKERGKIIIDCRSLDQMTIFLISWGSVNGERGDICQEGFARSINLII